MHWHAYAWIGNGADRARESERRPDWPGFSTGTLPPMRTGDWLAKSASQIMASFDDVDLAVKWLAEQYSRVEQTFLYPDRVGLEERIFSAKDLLPHQVDVMWGWWLKGGRFASIAMICCPNRDVSHPCPCS